MYPARLSPDLQPGAYRVLFQQTPHPFLKEVIEVAGRQGVACDGEYYYVSGSTALFGKLSPDEQQAVLCRIGELVDNEKDYTDKGNYLSLHNIDFKRTQTLCQGGQMFDFCFVKHRKGEVWERYKSI